MKKYTLSLILFFVFLVGKNLIASAYTSSVASFSEVLLSSRPIVPEVTTTTEEMRPKIIDEIKESKSQDAIKNLEQKVEQLATEQQSDKQRIKILEEGLAQCKMHIACISVAIVGGIVFLFYQAGIIQ